MDIIFLDRRYCLFLIIRKKAVLLSKIKISVTKFCFLLGRMVLLLLFVEMAYCLKSIFLTERAGRFIQL